MRRNSFHKKTWINLIWLPVIFGLSFGSMACDSKRTSDQKQIVATKSQAPSIPTKTLAQSAEQTLLALKHQDGPQLAKLVSPSLGLRFTPYAWDNFQENLVLKPEEVEGIYRSKTPKVWGSFDGSGDPISLDPGQYMARFVWNTDYSQVKQKEAAALDAHLEKNYPYLKGSEVQDEILKAYPRAETVTYFYPGVTGPEGGAMDWSWLTLVFVPQNGSWFLAGIVHRQWTI